jgi:hypothetical protein
MQQSDRVKQMDSYQFPRQKALCEDKPFSRAQLRSLLETAYAASPPFTGYLKISGDEQSIFFLFFFEGSPCAAGKYADSKPVSYSIQEFGAHLVKSSGDSLFISLYETDPVLLKCMLLFLQEEPSVKAPTSLIDFEHIVRQIGDVGSSAMITLCRDHKFNFFFFWDGKAALAHYADLTFERPEGMTIDEEMLLYAFQPGEIVRAFIFRDMITTMAEDSKLLDIDSLYNLLTIGFPKNRRKEDRELSPVPAAIEGVESLVKSLLQKQKLPNIILFVESGPLQGERFTVTLPCTIGRKGCDLILDDCLVSRRHAEIKIVEGALELEDLASTNGTKVNGKTVTKKQLSPSDLITIGPTNLRIFSPER